MDLLKDHIPEADLIFCRDCLVHLSYDHALTALRNIARGGSKYLLTTTFTERTSNRDITTGEWRPINLQLPPFSLPPPERIIVEGCTEAGGVYSDKSLGLWKIEQLSILS